MDTQVFELIKSISDNIASVALLCLVAYRLSVALSAVSKEKNEAVERYVRHLEEFHPPPPDKD